MAALGLRRDTEPDYRFSFANERTYLAWIRWALAERAMRRAGPLPSFGLAALFTLALVVIAATLIAVSL